MTTCVASKAARTLVQWMATRPVPRGGRGRMRTFSRVVTASVPSEPASKEQRLKGGPPGVKGAWRARRSRA